MSDSDALAAEGWQGEGKERSLGFRLRGWAGIALLLPLTALTLAAQPMIRLRDGASLLVEAAGWAFFVAGAAFRFWATLHVGGRKRIVVVREGPYSICRNPLYLGSLLLGIAGALFANSLTLAAGIAVLFVFYGSMTVPAEEAYLLRRLGEPYRDYLRTVPRFWPRPSLYRAPTSLPVDVTALRVEVGRASRWIWLPVLGLAMAYLRSRPWWPQSMTLP